MPREKTNKSPRSLPKRSGNNADQVAGAFPSWQPFLSQYRDLRVLSFKSPKDLDAAIDLLWTDELRTLPHATPDGKSLVVPAEAVAYFSRAGLRFTEKKLRSISELSAMEIRRLRR